LDPATKKAVAISPLKAETAEEKRLFAQGQANYNLKKATQAAALRKQTPNDEESDLIHVSGLLESPSSPKQAHDCANTHRPYGLLN
jgi:acyl-coenzyme A thioesterase 9